jgi:hypothetical protein
LPKSYVAIHKPSLLPAACGGIGFLFRKIAFAEMTVSENVGYRLSFVLR